MEKLRSAVVGCGAVSKNHGRALKNADFASLEYAVDIDACKAEAFASAYGGRSLTDYRELYDKGIDVAHIATPHNTHPQIAMDLMEHGINVFCEKPLAITAYDAKRMIAVSERTGKMLGVCFQNRLNDSSVRAKKIIESGEYGKVISGMAIVAWDRHGKYYTESPWRGTYEGEGGGTIINQSIHTLDLLSYLTGGVESLSAVDAKLRDTDDYEVDDSAMILFNLKCGATAVGYCTNCYPQSKICTVELHLERAILSVKQSGLTIETSDGERIEYESETLKGEKSEWGISHAVLIEDFYRSIMEGRTPVSECHTGLEAIKIVNAIHNSRGKTVKIAD